MHLSCLAVLCLALFAPSMVFGQRRPPLLRPQPQFQPQVATPQQILSNDLLTTQGITPDDYRRTTLLPQSQYRPQLGLQQAATAGILTQVQDINPDGSFYTKFETTNGIAYEEQGQLSTNGQVEAEKVVGSASWTDDEGQRFSITWQADENGANFQGDHLPTPPPIPEAIQRALAWIAANPGRDGGEGQYREQEYENRARYTSPQQQLLTGSPTYPTTLRPTGYPTTLRPAAYSTTL